VLSLNLARRPWLVTRLTNLGAFASSWLAALRFTSDAKAPTLESPPVSVKAAGGIFFFGSKAQRSEPFRKKMMPAAGPCTGVALRGGLLYEHQLHDAPIHRCQAYDVIDSDVFVNFVN